MSGEVPDDSICPVCRSSTYVGETISCETCMYWFHFECVGVTHEDECVINENEPYYCPKCTQKAAEKKTKSSQRRAQASSKKAAAAAAVAAASASPSLSSRKPRKSTQDTKRKASSEKRQAAHVEDEPPPPIKLKISLGSPTKSAKASLLKAECASPASAAVAAPPKALSSGSDSDVDVDDDKDEEEKWLDAVEAGNVDNHVDSELRSINNPKLMTARQRALKGGACEQSDKQHVSLGLTPTSSRKAASPNVDKVEVMRQKAIKAIKRKEIENEKREETKKKTMDKLLTTKTTLPVANTSTIQNSAGNCNNAASDLNVQTAVKVPSVNYTVTASQRLLSYPAGMEYPIVQAKTKLPPAAKTCAVCKIQPKKYSCSKTKRPLCSLACYKTNAMQMVAAS